MTRKQPEPNYDLMFRSAVSKLQGDYNLLKNAITEDLRWSWYDNEGNMVRLSGYEERTEKINGLRERITFDLSEIERLRGLRNERLHKQTGGD